MRKYTKLGIVILGVLLCNSIFTNGQPPTGPLVVSPEIHSDKKVTFRYLAPLAKEVKLSAQFEKSQVVMTKDAVGIWSVAVGPIKGIAIISQVMAP